MRLLAVRHSFHGVKILVLPLLCLVSAGFTLETSTTSDTDSGVTRNPPVHLLFDDGTRYSGEVASPESDSLSHYDDQSGTYYSPGYNPSTDAASSHESDNDSAPPPPSLSPSEASYPVDVPGAAFTAEQALMDLYALTNPGAVAVSRSTLFPLPSIVRITLRKNPIAEPNAYSTCTGWLVESDRLITAAHCLHQGRGGTFYPISTYRMTARANSSPLPTCRAVSLAINTGWSDITRTDDPARWDYGAIKLNCTVGSNTGWMGFWYSVGQDHPWRQLGEATGYAGPNDSYELYRTQGERIVENDQTIIFTNAATAGMSGGPRWNQTNPTCGACAHAVIAKREQQGAFTASPWINRTVFDHLVFFKHTW